jgi:hypothetical protein
MEEELGGTAEVGWRVPVQKQSRFGAQRVVVIVFEQKAAEDQVIA